MEFKCDIKEHNDTYSIILLQGEVDLHSVPKVQSAIEQGSREVKVVALDVTQVEFMDSTALSTLMRAKESLKQHDISLRLISPSPAVERIFEVTGFSNFFEIYPSTEAAISLN